jgi:hypothetical protein
MFANPYHIMIEIHKRSLYICGGEDQKSKTTIQKKQSTDETTHKNNGTKYATEFVDGFAIHLETRTVQWMK